MIALKAIFSDDLLLEKLALKGGNAIDLVYEISTRSSLDLDFSITGDFIPLDDAGNRIKKTLEKTFQENDYKVFDFKFSKRPPKISGTTDSRPFWGGYSVEFKIINPRQYEEYKNCPQKRSSAAQNIGPQNQKKFSIDISKCEYCLNRREHDIEGLSIYVYTPEMLIFEKLRAICQQTDQYNSQMESNMKPRAADFIDIYIIKKKLRPKLTDPAQLKILHNIFKIKKVKLSLLNNLENYREFHRQGFQQVISTISHSEVRLESFDFYFNYTKKVAKILLDKTAASV